MEKIPCNKCGEEKSRKNPLFPFITNTRESFWLCMNCYNQLSKDEKKKFEYTGNVKMPASTKITTGFLTGLVGLSASSGSYSSGYRKGIEHVMMKNNLTQKMLDEKSIDLFDMHFFACSLKQNNIVLREFGVKR